MATVTGLTAERMQQIEGDVIVDGDVVGGNLILTKNNGNTINAGSVIGPPGPAGPVGPSGNETIGTSLPASPVDGQRALLVDSLTVPSWAWLFRYVASITDAYKWVFEGGSPLHAFTGTETGVIVSPDSFQQITNPDIIIPRNGIYGCQVGCEFVLDTPNRQVFLSICNASVNMDPITIQPGLVITNYDTIHLDSVVTANGGQTLRLTVLGSDIRARFRTFWLTPRRVA